ncbi:molybdopterin-dependent oxidoreductase [Pseudonocardia sp. K10HN5]|uniref:Molybdopterin-dependent oxidoreductase n=1 Tax=Pseudonocardia acidicola TaxID=2724939 RepID=A0ABX1SA76_9PSEU|nr:molybdopterin-dependent oxidoreductase [Pseudonocardia acidicola]
MPRGLAALIGVLAVGAALGAGHVVAGLVSPSSSPYLAVGDTVIRFSPQWLTEFAKTTFGTADKPVLLGGMAVVIALVAAAAGIASRRNPGPGVAVVVVLGVLGFLAVLFVPVFAPLDLVAPLASLLAGVLVFRFLHGLALRTYAAAAAGPSGGPAVSRRGVLIGSSAAVGVGALAAGAGGLFLGRGIEDSRAQVTARLAALTGVQRAPAIPAGADYAAELGTTRFVTPNPDFYRIDVALRIPTRSAADWRLRIHGMVDNEMTLTFDDLLRRPLVEKTITMMCVSNEVGGPLISTANFIGVSLRDILLEAGVRPGAQQVFTTSIDGWTAGTPTDVIMEPGRHALLAVGMNGEALPPEHGFPVRMVVPGLYGFVSATKWIADMELTTFDARQPYWLQRGWAQQAPIKTQSRIDSPRGFSTVPAGKVAIAGIAWSQPTGISKVEVRMDGGPWRVADLATEVSGDTWRMWRTEFDLAPGSHTVQTRATDRNGRTQTEMRADPIPDGATGWPATIFNVS